MPEKEFSPVVRGPMLSKGVVSFTTNHRSAVVRIESTKNPAAWLEVEFPADLLDHLAATIRVNAEQLVEELNANLPPKPSEGGI